MGTSTRLTFKGAATGLICCAVVVAFLNLYMNILATRNSSSFQIDLSADGDVVAFHQFDIPGIKSGGSSVVNERRRKLRQTTKLDEHHSDLCMGLCPGIGSLSTQADYVKALINARMKNKASNSFKVEIDIKASKFSNGAPIANMSSDWSKLLRQSDKLISSRRISVPDDTELKMMLKALHNVRLVRAATPTRGTQLKVMLGLEGGQWAVWKPKLLERSDIVTGAPTDGPDRHNGEIASFYVGHLLGIDRTPFVVGRTLNMKEELYDIADEPLRKTFFVHNTTKRYCFYGKCVYCKSSLPACGNQDGRLEGALILWFPSTYSNLTRIRNPWARTYHGDRLAFWQTNASYCNSIAGHEFFGKAPVFMDLMETAVFDFLIGNADRHRLEFFKDYSPKSLLLLDNGKSFGNPTIDELTILAPLYQCCRIRRRLYQTMLRYSEINFGALLNDRYLKYDPLYPILTDSHLEAINRRLRKVLLVVASCMDQHGSEKVLVDDSY